MNKIKELSKKTKIILVAVLVLIVSVGTFVVLNISFSGNKINTFYNVDLKNHETEEVKIYNVDMKEENGITSYEANIQATKEVNVKYIKITIKDGENKDIVTLIGYVGSTLKEKEIKEIKASTDADLKNMKSITYEVIK